MGRLLAVGTICNRLTAISANSDIDSVMATLPISVLFLLLLSVLLSFISLHVAVCEGKILEKDRNVGG